MYIEREILRKFEKVATAYPVVALVGARQAGKTTFLKEQMKKIKCNYLLFDDPDVRNLFDEDVKKFERQHIQGYDVAILDEVQYCKEAGRKLKYLADTDYRLWITSSSEILLGKEVLSHLVGRVSVLRLYPFSLSEFLRAKNQREMTQTILQRSVWEHLSYGGYPKVVTTDDLELKKTILRDLYETMLLKDVANTFSIDDIRALETLADYLAANIGNLISYESVTNDVGVSYQTLKKYLDAMEKSYFIVRVCPFYTNKTKEIVKQPKIYFVDTGLRNLISNSFGTKPDGKTFENYVLSELIKMGFTPKHWRSKTKAEVDFIIENEAEIVPIEVKLRSNNKIGRSLRSFIETYKPSRAFIVTYEGEAKMTKAGDCQIIYTNVLNLRKQLAQK